MRSRWFGLVMVLGLVVASCGGGESEAGGHAEGILIHGDWVIAVYNSDGSLDERVEFSNALDHGGETVTRLLAREISPKLWSVHLEAPAAGPSPCLFNQAEVVCVLNEDDASLSIQTMEGDNPGIRDVLRLEGSIVADQNGEILTVKTNLQGCNFGDTDPVSCGGVTFGDSIIFSSTDLPAPVAVDAGQTMDVQVDLKFETGS